MYIDCLSLVRLIKALICSFVFWTTAVAKQRVKLIN